MVCPGLGIHGVMHFLGDMLDRRPALSADGLCETALAIFVHDPDCRAIAIVDGDRPVALLSREVFLARMEAPGATAKRVLDAAEPDPLVAEASEEIGPFVAAANVYRPAALLGGFVVVENGVYAGVADLARLLPALGAARRPSVLLETIDAEVREPISDALAAVDALRRLRLPEGAAAHLDTIAEASQTALSLLAVAAELQWAETEHLQVATAPRRLQSLMDDLEARWRDKADLAGVTLLVAYDGAPDCAAMIDGERLMQVFDALIDHALASGGRGVIEAALQVRMGVGGVVLAGRVRDNSVAYSRQYLDAIFSGGAVAGATSRGVQLRMMLAERSIAAMAGMIEARANPGPGAVIAFEFPAELAAAEAGAAVDDLGLGAQRRAAHILVVDDNATNRMVVEALCEMFDCSTESVVDGVEAIEAAKAGRFDVILMDIKMPRMDGVSATREIRKLPAPAGRVPIVALTANADAEQVAEYLAAGMGWVVEKPIKPDRLMAALDAALSGQTDAAAAAA
jgi:CheY-like chemotaxis protein